MQNIDNENNITIINKILYKSSNFSNFPILHSPHGNNAV